MPGGEDVSMARGRKGERGKSNVRQDATRRVGGVLRAHRAQPRACVSNKVLERSPAASLRGNGAWWGGSEHGPLPKLFRTPCSKCVRAPGLPEVLPKFGNFAPG